MATMRLFRNGNSQAVRIPAELAYEHSDLELEIERRGDELRLRSADECPFQSKLLRCTTGRCIDFA